MPLFEVAIIEKPTKKEAEEGASEKLVFGPKAIIAKDAQGAGIAAVMSEKSNLDQTRADRWDVIVRPFVS